MKTRSLNIINLHQGNTEQKRQEILSYYNQQLALEEQLYSALATENAFYQRADPLRHPIIFYYGHTAVFFMNKLILAGLVDARTNPELESIFAIGVDEMSWDDLNEQHYNWPGVAETSAYRNKVADLVRHLIKTLPLKLPINWESPFWPILMGIEHLNIHIETSSVLIRQLPIEMVKANTFGKRCTQTNLAPKNELVQVEGGLVKLGKEKDHRLYGWDCEYGEASEEVKAFQAAKYLTSNQEFLGFVEAKGYKTKKYWTEEGWNWCNYKKAEHPLFWIKENQKYKLRLLDEIIAMPWDWPVEINQLEAKAFCNWKAEQTGEPYRLPTEAEWLHLYEINQVPDVDEWKQAPGNINMEHYSSSCPVNQYQFGDFYDLIGNVWQWTETPINGYNGFKVHPLYDDFSTPTFDQKHNLFKGGSWISMGNEASKHARYAFRRHFYQHAGFRYIISEENPKIEDNSYETDTEVALSCENNYGKNVLGTNNFYEEISHIALELLHSPKNSKILDINCETGRLAFELAKSGAKITALDASARFIKVAFRMQEQGSIKYIVKNEGDLVYFREKQLKDLNVNSEMAQNIQFMQVDASNTKTIFTGYDMIIATSLLHELYDPGKFLNAMSQRINKDGILILSSTYNWDIKNTKKENWLGGFKKDGEPVYSFEHIKEVLSADFELIKKPFDLAKVSRLSSREFAFNQEEVSIWKKKS